MKQRSRFDDEAAQWDQNPGRVEVARAVGSLICRRISIQRGWRVLDYGAGTGLLTLCIQPFAGEITALDTSDGMTAELRRKLVSAGIDNVQVRLWDLGAEPYPDGDFDLVVSSMTMHHIADIPLVLKRMAQVLRPGGYLAVADLDAEDGSFHTDKQGVYHNGFERAQTANWLSEAGFVEIDICAAHSIGKPDAAGQLRNYGVFLALARKGAGQLRD
jgi:ubiquinone/menaquinone biosynthesis C-methylase UbiE